MSAGQEVLDERARQRAKWSDEHDDGHDPGDLAQAAMHLATGEWVFESWPKELRKKNPTPRARLVIAAALLIAEIERIDRASPVCSECRGKGTTPDVDPAYQCKCDTCGGSGKKP